MGKEFQRKYMHPTRRKLVDMVQTGEYDKNSQIGWTKTEEQRNVGDVWEDKYYKYEKKNGYTIKTGKNHEALQEIRNYCETDVINTYLLYLVFQHHNGSISKDSFAKCKEDLINFISNQQSSKTHFKDKQIFFIRYRKDC